MGVWAVAALFGSIAEMRQSFGTSSGWLFLTLLLKLAVYLLAAVAKPSGVVDTCLDGILSISVLRREFAICNGVMFASLFFFRRIL